MSNHGIKELYKKHHDKIKGKLAKYEYRYFRYRLEYSLIFLYLAEERNISHYNNYIRLTDTLLMLDKNFYCVVYEGANAEQASKAANNLLNHYKKEFRESKIYINALSPGKKKMHADEIVNRLFETLETIILESRSNVVVALNS